MKKTILFYFGHPSQFLFARETIKNLQEKQHKVIILIKSKDVLENLVKESQFNYQNILAEGRKDSKAGIIIGLIKRDWRLFRFVRNKKIDIMAGSDPSLAHIGRLLKIPVITFLEDDAEVIPNLAKTTYPFTKHIFAPHVCQVGENYKKKKLGYNGYMKLGYLHPNYFMPYKTKAPETYKPYILIRLAKLTAYHDSNIKGLNFTLIDKILEIINDNYELLITSESDLPDLYSKYKLNSKPEDIHHVLYYSSLFISDSQSMTVESAILGTPSVRYSDFTGRISVIEELEHRYKLTHSVKPPDETNLLSTIGELLEKNDLKEEYKKRKEKMLSEKIDVTELFTDLLDRYPSSIDRFS